MPGRSLVRLSLLLAAALVWVAPLPLHAQDAATGTVTGQVLGNDRAPLAGALVAVEGTNRRALSNDAGYYRLTGVPAGSVELTAAHIGYETGRMTLTIRSGESVSRNFELSLRPLVLQGVEVQGDRYGSRAAALNRQATAGSVMNVISAEQIERFPDPQVADALRRVPGVATFDDRGEAENVFLRGMAPGMTVVTLDGERLPTTGLRNREVSLAAMPAEMLSSIEVVKAITPDMDADASAGTINLVTRQPLGDRTYLNMSAAGGLHENGYGTNALAGLHFGQSRGDLSYMLRFNFRRNDRAMDDVRHFWGTADFGNGGVDVLDQLRLSTYEIRRDRYALNARVDYDLSDRSFIYARGLVNLLDEYSIRHQYRVTPEDGNHVAPGVATRGRLETIGREMTRDEVLSSLTVGGETGLGRVGVDYSMTVAQGKNEQPFQRYLNFRSDRYDMEYDISDRNFADWRIAGGDGVSHLDPTTLNLRRHEVRTDFVTDTDVNARINFEVPITVGDALGNVRFGGRYFTKTKDREAWVRRYGIPSDIRIPLSEVTNGNGAYRPIVGGRYNIGNVVDWRAGQSFLDQNFASRIAPLEDVDRTYEVSLDDESIDYQASESIGAGFAMGTLDFGALRIIGGVRVEHTETTYRGNESLFEQGGSHAGTRQLEEGNSYLNIFPMAHLRYQLDDQTNLRFAWTNTLARPDFSILAPFQRVNHDDGTIERGNPALLPSRVMSVDLLAERFFQDVGLLSVGVFFKRINDFTYRRTFTETRGDFAGFEVRMRENGATADVAGVEAAWQQRLAFLPGALNGLGVMANYTYTASRAQLVEIDRQVRLPRQIPHVGNAGLTYDLGGFQGALTLNHRSRYLFEVTADQVASHRSHLYPSADRYLRAQTQLDMSASYEVTRGGSLFVELNNLLDTPQTWYDGHPDMHYRSSYNMRWGLVGFRYDLR
ncbi:MAG: TonB-dependent receptor [Gemmatimonadales bacterium]|nr:MAG: TonB-dependent receptor [Gemmatimonadales bacterium]